MGSFKFTDRKIVAREINIVDQLQKINLAANELLDILIPNCVRDAIFITFKARGMFPPHPPGFRSCARVLTKDRTLNLKHCTSVEMFNANPNGVRVHAQDRVLGAPAIAPR
jgi:hypothetical protein